MNIKKENKGFVLLYAILTATVVAAIGATFVSIIVRQITLSIIGRESQIAFYAADSTADCFHFYGTDLLYGGFIREGEDWVYRNNNIDDEPIQCGNDEFTQENDMIWSNSFDNGEVVYMGSSRELTKNLKVYFDNGSCATVHIKQIAGEDDLIKVRGYNLSSSNIDECPTMTERTVVREFIR